MKIYLQIYYLGCGNAAELQYSLFIPISIVYVMQQVANNSTSFALKLCIPPSGDDNTDSDTKSQHIQSLVTHGITD